MGERFRTEFQREYNRAVLKAREKGWPITQTLPSGKVIALRRLTDRGAPVYYETHNADAATTISTDDVYPGAGNGFSLTGDSITLAIWDGGHTNDTHTEFGTRLQWVDSDEDGIIGASDHATHVSGTVLAAGSDNQARGMAYEAEAKTYYFSDDMAEMSFAAGSGLNLSNHSYGQITGWSNVTADTPYWYGDTTVSSVEDYEFGFYTDGTEQWDQIARANPYYTIVKSAGNDRNDVPSTQPTEHYVYSDSKDSWVLSTTVRDTDGGSNGYDSLPPNSTAKNILVVGAVQDIAGGYSSPSDVTATSFTSWGPTDDGRIKPDVVASGDNLYSSVWIDNYATYSGTSMSAPSVTGSAALLQEQYLDFYGTIPLSSTIRGLIIHAADEAGSNPGPDYSFGWGLMNTRTAAEHIVDNHAHDTEESTVEFSIQEGDTVEFTRWVDNSSNPIKATLNWTDTPGNPVSKSLDPSDRMLRNNLDLRVIAPDGTVHRPWVLDPDNPSDGATRGDNNVDNVEQVLVNSPSADSYTLRVTFENSIPGTQNQWASLLLSNLLINLEPNADFTFSPADPHEKQEIQFTDLSSDTDGTIVSRTWDFGDGTTSTTTNPTHKYDTAGSYTVSLTVEDDSGGINTDTRVIDVDSLADVSITQPGDQHDTNVQNITVSGTATRAETGDSVTVSVNRSDTTASSVESDSSWSVSGVTLQDSGDSVIATLHDSDTGSLVEDTALITVNYDTVAPSIDSGPIFLQDGADTLRLGDLEGSGTLRDGLPHEIGLSVAGADTVTLYHTNDGTLASTGDTPVALTPGTGDTWTGEIPNPNFDEGDTINFIIEAVDDATNQSTEDSGASGFLYEVQGVVNHPPTVSLIEPDTGAIRSRDVPGTYVIADSQSEPGTVSIDVSQDSGATWSTATIPEGDTAGVSSSRSGDTHTFSWDSVTDLGTVYDTEIRLRMRATDGDSTGDYDTSGAFTVDNVPPDTPTLLEPADKIDTNETSIFFDWSTVSDTGVGVRDYYFELATDTTFSVTVTESFETTSETTVTVTEGTYAWRVYARDDAGNTSALSDSRTLTVDTSPPSIDTPSLTVTDQNDTLGLSHLDGGPGAELIDFRDHGIDLGASGADTVVLFYRNDGLLPTESDTSIVLSNPSADSWTGTITSTNVSPGDTITFMLSARDRATNETTADSAGNGFAYKVTELTTPTVSITEPPDGHDTRIQTISVGGTSAMARTGDSVQVDVNGQDTVVTTVESTNSWSVSGVPLTDMGDTVRTYLHDYDTTSEIEDTDTITVNFDNLAETYPQNLAVVDTGIDTATIGWDAFGSDPDTGSGFRDYALYYDTGTEADSTSNRWTSNGDTRLSQLSTDTSVVQGLSGDTEFAFRIGYRDHAGNVSTLSDTIRVTVKSGTPPSIHFEALKTPAANQPVVATGSGTFPVRGVFQNVGGRSGTVSVDLTDLTVWDTDGDQITSFSMNLEKASVSVPAADTATVRWSLDRPDTSLAERLGQFKFQYDTHPNRLSFNVAAPALMTRLESGGGIDTWESTLGDVRLVAGGADGEPVHDVVEVSGSDRIIVTVQSGDTNDVDTPFINPDYDFSDQEAFASVIDQADSKIAQGDTAIVNEGLFNIGIWKNQPGLSSNYVGGKDDLNESVLVEVPEPVVSDPNLAVAKLDPRTNEWSVITRTPEIEDNRLRFRVSPDDADPLGGFSIFRVIQVGVTSSGSADETVVYPNPFVPFDGRDRTGSYGSGTDEGIHFSAGPDRGFPAGTILRIHTVSGELVDEVRLGRSGIIQWDARTRGGDPIASGVYIYRIETPDGSEKVGKFSVVR